MIETKGRSTFLGGHSATKRPAPEETPLAEVDVGYARSMLAIRRSEEIVNRRCECGQHAKYANTRLCERYWINSADLVSRRRDNQEPKHGRRQVPH
jgi:hypothetical protein